MALKLFGFRIGKEEQQKPTVVSFAPPENDDGAVTIAEGGVFGTTIDLEGTTKTEAALITKYREMVLQPECERAVDDIVNEAIVGDEQEAPVNIVLDDVEVSASIKDTITERDTLDTRASTIVSAARRVIDEHLTPPPDDNPIDSLPSYFSDSIKQAIRDRNYAYIHSDDTTLYNKAKNG